MKSLRAYLALAIVAAFASYILIDGPNLIERFAYAITKGENSAKREQLAELARNDHMSPLFAEVAKVLKPAVVEVRVTKKIQMPNMPEMDDFMRRFFGDENPFGQSMPNMPKQGRQGSPAPREYMQHGLGSGVIIDAKNGYVLTNYHVVANAEETQIVLADGKTIKAKWVRTDPQTDLAIVKIDGDGFIDAPLGDSDKLEIGEWVLAIGSPEGLSQTVTAGIISAKGRTTNNSANYQSFLQTDASINHGNSGGPLVNMRGEVIGINTAIVSQTGVNEGIGLAIPSNMVRNVMSQLIEKGKVTRGLLGVTIQNVDESLAKSFKLDTRNGALISSVLPGGPAEKAGLKDGDFITAVAGKPVTNVNELRNSIADIEPGKEVAVEFYRNGKKMELKVKMDAQSAAMTATGPISTTGQAAAEKLGLEVGNITKELAAQYGYKTAPTGVIITDVAQNSPAETAGLKAGMAITNVNGKDVASVQEFTDAISGKESAEGVRLRVVTPSGGALYVILSMGKPE